MRLNTPATVESIRALNPDRVVVASGAVRPAPQVPGGALPIVQTGDTLRDLMVGTAASDGAIHWQAVGDHQAPLIRRLTKFAVPMGKDGS